MRSCPKEWGRRLLPDAITGWHRNVLTIRHRNSVWVRKGGNGSRKGPTAVVTLVITMLVIIMVGLVRSGMENTRQS